MTPISCFFLINQAVPFTGGSAFFSASWRSFQSAKLWTKTIYSVVLGERYCSPGMMYFPTQRGFCQPVSFNYLYVVFTVWKLERKQFLTNILCLSKWVFFFCAAACVLLERLPSFTKVVLWMLVTIARDLDSGMCFRATESDRLINDAGLWHEDSALQERIEDSNAVIGSELSNLLSTDLSSQQSIIAPEELLGVLMQRERDTGLSDSFSAGFLLATCPVTERTGKGSLQVCEYLKDLHVAVKGLPHHIDNLVTGAGRLVIKKPEKSRFDMSSSIWSNQVNSILEICCLWKENKLVEFTAEPVCQNGWHKKTLFLERLDVLLIIFSWRHILEAFCCMFPNSKRTWTSHLALSGCTCHDAHKASCVVSQFPTVLRSAPGPLQVVNGVKQHI